MFSLRSTFRWKDNETISLFWSVDCPIMDTDFVMQHEVLLGWTPGPYFYPSFFLSKTYPSYR